MDADDLNAVTLHSVRLALEPVRAGHAEEMVELLADRRLYTITGGEPPSLDELRARYARQATGRSPDGVDRWLNWILRRREDRRAVGFVQAALAQDTPPPASAVLAWVLGLPYQGRGYAREAAAEVMRWLAAGGVARFVAYIHPDHAASMAVARSLGMRPTDARVDEEVVWEGGLAEP